MKKNIKIIKILGIETSCDDTGVAIISTKYRSIQDLVTNNKEGFLLQPNNPKDIAEKLKFLYQNKLFLEKMKENAFKKYINNLKPRIYI